MRNFISQNGPNGWFSEFDHPNLGMIGRFSSAIGLCVLGAKIGESAGAVAFEKIRSAGADHGECAALNCNLKLIACIKSIRTL